MTSISTIMSLALLCGGIGAQPEERTASEPWYAGNACIECHRASGGRLAEIVDEEWAKSVHFESKTPCQECHGGDASLTRDQFASDDEFKKASHESFDSAFLFLRDRGDVEIRVVPEGGVIYACRECHEGTIERHQGDPHSGATTPSCLFGPYGGVSVSRARGINYICSKCHARAAEKHLASPHGSFGAPSCVFCHGDGTHKIPPSNLDILDPRPREELGRCAPCHKPVTMNVVAEIRKTFEESTEQIEVSRAQFDDLEEMGYRNLALGEMHAHVDDIQRNLREISHGCNILEINELARSIKQVAKETAYDFELVQALREARERQTRRALGTAGLLLILAGMLVLYRMVFRSRRVLAA